MNIKFCLIATLLSLAVANAYAGDITINVPIELVNIPAANRTIDVGCFVGVGPAPAIPGAIWPISSRVGQGDVSVEVPSSGQLRQIVPVPITVTPGHSLDDATYYKCMLSGILGQPVLAGQNEVSGSIPR